MRKILTILIAIAACYTGNAQRVGALRITAASDTLLFVLSLDDVHVNNTPLNEVRVRNYPVGSVGVSIKTKGGLELKNYPIYLESGMENVFSLDVQNNKIKISPLSTVSLDSKLNAVPVNADFTVNEAGIVIPHLNEVYEVPAGDSAAMDSTVLHDAYTGKKGCHSRTSTKEIKEILAALDAEPISSRKITLTERFLRNNCILTSDLALIVQQFYFEDHRLEIIAKAEAAVFDLDNLHQLKELFKLNNNRTAFVNLLKGMNVRIE